MWKVIYAVYNDAGNVYCEFDTFVDAVAYAKEHLADKTRIVGIEIELDDFNQPTGEKHTEVLWNYDVDSEDALQTDSDGSVISKAELLDDFELFDENSESAGSKESRPTSKPEYEVNATMDIVDGTADIQEDEPWDELDESWVWIDADKDFVKANQTNREYPKQSSITILAAPWDQGFSVVDASEDEANYQKAIEAPVDYVNEIVKELGLENDVKVEPVSTPVDGAEDEDITDEEFFEAFGAALKEKKNKCAAVSLKEGAAKDFFNKVFNTFDNIFKEYTVKAIKNNAAEVTEKTSTYAKAKAKAKSISLTGDIKSVQIIGTSLKDEYKDSDLTLNGITVGVGSDRGILIAKAAAGRIAERNPRDIKISAKQIRKDTTDKQKQVKDTTDKQAKGTVEPEAVTKNTNDLVASLKQEKPKFSLVDDQDHKISSSTNLNRQIKTRDIINDNDNAKVVDANGIEVDAKGNPVKSNN